MIWEQEKDMPQATSTTNGNGTQENSSVELMKKIFRKS
jgi:hypothetical protein